MGRGHAIERSLRVENQNGVYLLTAAGTARPSVRQEQTWRLEERERLGWENQDPGQHGEKQRTHQDQKLEDLRYVNCAKEYVGGARSVVFGKIAERGTREAEGENSDQDDLYACPSMSTHVQ